MIFIVNKSNKWSITDLIDTFDFGNKQGLVRSQWLSNINDTVESIGIDLDEYSIWCRLESALVIQKCAP